MTEFTKGARRGAIALAAALMGVAWGCDDADPARVEVPVATVEVGPAGATLAPGDTVRLAAVARSATGAALTGRTFAWASGDSAVASVNGAGLVTAIADGVALVTASTGGRSATAEIRVEVATPEPPDVATLVPATITAGTNDFTLTVMGTGFSPWAVVRWNEIPLATWYVSGTELRASVPAGLVEAEGTPTVLVENPYPSPVRSGPVSFQVTAAPAASVEIHLAGNAVFVENRLPLTGTARDGHGMPIPGKHIAWTSGDTTIARIDGDGRVRGRAPGTVTLTATAEPVSATTTLYVLPAPPADLLYSSSSQAFPLAVNEMLVRSLAPGAGTSRVLPFGTPAFNPTPSPDGSRIAFAGLAEEDNLDIYVVNRDGTGLVRLTTHAAIDDHPVWSPDGSRIAFRSWRAGKSDIWVMNADGSAPVNLTHAAVWVPGEHNEHPAWSPDGAHIAFGRGFGMGQSIHVVSAAGGPLTEIVRRPGASLSSPAWSPDGGTLAFRREQVGPGTSDRSVEFAAAATGAPVYYFGLDLPHDADTPAWLEGGWLAVTGRAHPNWPGRTLSLHRIGGPEIVVPLEPAHGYAFEPRWIRR